MERPTPIPSGLVEKNGVKMRRTDLMDEHFHVVGVHMSPAPDGGQDGVASHGAPGAVDETQQYGSCFTRQPDLFRAAP